MYPARVEEFSKRFLVGQRCRYGVGERYRPRRPSGTSAPEKRFDRLDFKALLVIMGENWNNVFKTGPGFAGWHYIGEFRRSVIEEHIRGHSIQKTHPDSRVV
jgi:hypothetical protein